MGYHYAAHNQEHPLIPTNSILNQDMYHHQQEQQKGNILPYFPLRRTPSQIPSVCCCLQQKEEVLEQPIISCHHETGQPKLQPAMENIIPVSQIIIASPEYHAYPEEQRQCRHPTVSPQWMLPHRIKHAGYPGHQKYRFHSPAAHLLKNGKEILYERNIRLISPFQLHQSAVLYGKTAYHCPYAQPNSAQPPLIFLFRTTQQD